MKLWRTLILALFACLFFCSINSEEYENESEGEEAQEMATYLEEEAEKAEQGIDPEDEEPEEQEGEEETYPTGTDDGEPAPECGAIVEGYRFDLEPLMKTSGPDYMTHDVHGNHYYLNVCEDVLAPPEECKEIEAAGIRSPAFQVTNTSLCYWLGLLGDNGKPPAWTFIDAEDPLLGVEVKYFDGAQCSDGKTYREVRFQFFCAQEVESDLENGVLEFHNGCHYSVIWATKHGCPTNLESEGSERSWGWGFVLFCIIVAVCYIGFGCAYNVVNRGMRVGMEAMPHIDQWRLLPGYIMEGINFTTGKAQELTGQKTGYEKVDGVEYQWG